MTGGKGDGSLWVVRVRTWLVAGALGVGNVAALAVCPSDAEVVARADGALANHPLSAYRVRLSMDDAYCAQEKYVAALRRRFGTVAGYKVAFTSTGSQQRFKVTKPASGVLLAGMLKGDGARIPVDFGVRPLIEPDLLVTVKDTGIMDARNELEVAAHLDELRPFLELPALQLKAGEPLNGVTLVAFNLGARAGVYGQGVKIQATPEFVRALGRMDTVFTDADGTVLQQASASNLMGNPLRVVLWLIDHLKQRGETLRPGQVLSLGTLGKLFPLKAPGKRYTLTYLGLPGGSLSVSVDLR